MQLNFVRSSRSDRYFVAAANGNPHYLAHLSFARSVDQINLTPALPTCRPASPCCRR